MRISDMDTDYNAVEDWLTGEGEVGLVSVIIPSFNRALLIEDTLDSVRLQSWSPTEIIVIDDGSTDNTVACVEEYAKKYPETDLKVFCLGHGGANPARNLGMDKSRGEFIQFLDADDMLHTAKFNAQVSFLQNNLDLDFSVASRYVFTDSSKLPEVYPGKTSDDATVHSFFSGGSFVTLQPLFRRRSLRKVGKWDESLAKSQEGNFFGRLLLHGLKGMHQEDAFCFTRSHEGNSGNTMSWCEQIRYLVMSFEKLEDVAQKLGRELPGEALFWLHFHRARVHTTMGRKREALSDLYQARQLAATTGLRSSFSILARILMVQFLGCRLYNRICDYRSQL